MVEASVADVDEEEDIVVDAVVDAVEVDVDA